MRTPADHTRVDGTAGNEGIKLARLDPNFPVVSPHNQLPPRSSAP